VLFRHQTLKRQNYISVESPLPYPQIMTLTLLFGRLEHVEVFPVDIKLDYKPKRVDYKALREGRTIELMNFFHFDGADITLRHITLSGVSCRFPYISQVRSRYSVRNRSLAGHVYSIL
jgi:hypothetical protein